MIRSQLLNIDAQPLPLPLYRASQVRELDRIAIEEMGIAGVCLMERAGSSAFSLLQQRWPNARRIVVVCGTGNNGGDGYVVARLAYLAGYDVTVLQLGDVANLHSEAKIVYDAMIDVGLYPQVFSPKKLSIVDVIVDALLGTGLDREVKGEYRNVIEAINRARSPILSLDVPSGLHADNGTIMGVSIRADVTISFIGLKRGLFTAEGPEYSGYVCFDDLQVPIATYDRVHHEVKRLANDILPQSLTRRPRNAHKGNFGHVLVIGGDHGMTGAVRLTAQAAARVGAGRISIATRQAHAALVNLTCPEIMSYGIENAEDLLPLLKNVDVVTIGPGMGQQAWGQAMLQAVKTLDKPIVVDADALNLMALEPFRFTNSVITPHPGEAARLLGISVTEVQADRFAAVQALTLRFGGISVLKGAGTLVTEEDGSIDVCTRGNPGMAAGGMGDLLTGVITGLIAQGFSCGQAARLGVCLHGQAGDHAARDGERGLLPSDLLPWLRYYANPDLLNTTTSKSV